MNAPMGLRGPLLRQFALVFVVVIGIGVVAPITATAATAYFSQVTTVKAAFGDASGNVPVFEGWKTAWCPTGYRVTGGGFEMLDDGSGNIEAGVLTGSMPTSNTPGRSGWRVRFDNHLFYGIDHLVVYAQCVR